jgi:extracellular sulfatase Sulf
VRNINVTHNYLYCEYVTGMITYFDLRVDPHQAEGGGLYRTF